MFDKSEGDIVIGNMPLLNENVYVKGSVKSYVSLTQAAWLDIRDHYPSNMREFPQHFINHSKVQNVTRQRRDGHNGEVFILWRRFS